MDEFCFFVALNFLGEFRVLMLIVLMLFKVGLGM